MNYSCNHSTEGRTASSEIVLCPTRFYSSDSISQGAAASDYSLLDHRRCHHDSKTLLGGSMPIIDLIRPSENLCLNSAKHSPSLKVGTVVDIIRSSPSPNSTTTTTTK
eukprot:PhF_6_TR24636/c0_g1_i1/m.33893